MAGQRQPIDLIIAKGKKNLTKAEIEHRKNQEIHASVDNIESPSYLKAAQKKKFREIADQLVEIKIMTDLDCDSLARYIISLDLYVKISKKIQTSIILEDPYMFDAYSKLQDRYFKQCRISAGDLGLTISSRCRLVVPQQNKEPPKENKFKRFAR